VQRFSQSNRIDAQQRERVPAAPGVSIELSGAIRRRARQMRFTFDS